MRTKEEIEHEIAALRALEPSGPHALKTAAKIQLAIEELEGHGYDFTAAEFSELPTTYQEIAQLTRDWLEEATCERPSEGWQGLVSQNNPTINAQAR